MIFNYIFITG